MKRVAAYWKKWGVDGLKLYVKKKQFFSPYIQFQLSELRAPIFLRHNTSDVKTFDKIFLDEEYHVSLDHPPEIIIDAGANIGAASVYFAARYPRAKIFSIEPETSNFEMLLKNTAPYPNIRCLQKALWYTNEPLVIKNQNVNKESFEIGQKEEDREQEIIQSITVNDLIQQFDLPGIDILKIDIEGAEKEVFSNNMEWLQKVGLIFIEYHDRKKTGCRDSVVKAVAPYVKTVFQKGETDIMVIEQRG